MSFHSVSGPRCLVQIYPWEGGIYSLSSQGTPGRIVTCVVQKDIRAAAGTFEIILAPGGPTGVDGPPTWIDVLTPMSTVQIGMQRGDRVGVIMIGVITDVSESTSFDEGRVVRTTTVIGKDIGYFWENFSFFSLASLGLFEAEANAELPFGPGFTELAAIANNISPAFLAGLLNGNPADVAFDWYTVIMLKLLDNTVLNNGANFIPFADAVTTLIEAFPQFDIPFGLNYIESEFTFDAKIKSILEFPQYEVWYGTMPSDFAQSPVFSENVDATQDGADFTIPDLDASSKAVFVGRINPIPVMNDDLGSMDTSKWDALATSIPDAGFISCNLQFSAGEVANLYMLQSQAIRQLVGNANGNNMAQHTFIDMGVDLTSLSRFGYRPHWQQTNWLNDVDGIYAQEHPDEFPPMVDDLLARVCSWYHPIPLMAHAEVTYPLMPNVFAGTKFKFNPKKYDADWTFYIKSVTHEFHFGGPSTTTLGLERGLPSDVYADPGLLLAVYKGTAERVDGGYLDIVDTDGLKFEPIVGGSTLEFLHKIDEGFPKPQNDISSE